LGAAIRSASADAEEGVERGERRRADAAVGRQIRIVLGVAVERGERTLEKGDRDRRPHVGAGVKQLVGDPRAALGDFIQARPQPIEPPIDRDRLAARQLLHRPGVAVGAGDGLGDAEAGRATLIGRIVDVPALPVDQSVDQPVNIYRLVHAVPPSSRQVNNQIGVL
jgi:hypothetical protein